MIRPITYERALPHQMERAVREAPIAYLPLGSLEWHGKHMALGTDSIKARGILEHAAVKHGGVVLPPIYWAFTSKWHPWSFGNFGVENLCGLCQHIFVSLAEVGFRVLVGVTGHDVKEQVQAMQSALDATRSRYAVDGFVMMENDLTDFGEHRMDHAAAWETSIMMYLDPGAVDMTQIENSPIDGNIRMAEWESPGIGGKDPRHGAANPELGRMLVEGMADAIGKKAREVLEQLRKSERWAAGPSPGGDPG